MARIGVNPSNYKDITKSDTVKLDPPADGLFVGGAGVAVIKGADGVVGTFLCQAGQIIPGTICYVMSTDTTATNFVAFYG